MCKKILIYKESMYVNDPIPWCGKIGTGIFPWSGEATTGEKKFPQESRKAHFIFPRNGLAGLVKKNFPRSGGAATGEIFFHHDC